MDIQPTKSGSSSPKGPDRLDRSAAAQPVRPEERPAHETASAAPDRVQISDEARALQDKLARERAVAQLPPGRLREMLQRIYDGFYDRPEVRNVVLERLTEDLKATPQSDEG